jgi:hypothetical protein
MISSNDIKWHGLQRGAAQNIELPDYPTLQQVSLSHRLNELQHAFFMERGLRLLMIYCNTKDEGSFDLQQHIALLAGNRPC